LRPLKKRQRQWLAKIEALRDNGLTWHEIADKTSIPMTTVYSRFQSYQHRKLAERLLTPEESPLIPEETA
jgi:hypothetical protein